MHRAHLAVGTAELARQAVFLGITPGGALPLGSGRTRRSIRCPIVSAGVGAPFRQLLHAHQPEQCPHLGLAGQLPSQGLLVRRLGSIIKVDAAWHALAFLEFDQLFDGVRELVQGFGRQEQQLAIEKERRVALSKRVKRFGPRLDACEHLDRKPPR